MLQWQQIYNVNC